MRGSKAKELRRYVKLDAPDLPSEVVYTTVQQSHHSPQLTTILGDCQRRYYKLLKKIWKFAS